MKRINSRQKGKRIEREACKFLEEITGEKWERTSQHCGNSRDSADVRPVNHQSPYAKIHVEVKGNESIDVGTTALQDACDQAVRDSAGKPWVVLWRKKHGTWRVTTSSLLASYSVRVPTLVTIGGFEYLGFYLKELAGVTT